MRSFIALPLPPEITSLLANIERDLQRFGADVRWCGVGSIHLTLGRVQGRRNLQPLLDHIRIGAEPVEARFTARQCNVYRSTLRPAGAVYDVLKEIRLAGEGDPR